LQVGSPIDCPQTFASLRVYAVDVGAHHLRVDGRQAVESGKRVEIVEGLRARNACSFASSRSFSATETRIGLFNGIALWTMSP
jgi:hypothetical protein